jgi:hypothetical protein
MIEKPSSMVAAFIILLILFFGGGFVGEQLALALAPRSGVSRLIGFLALPASFIVGFVFWAGAATVVLIKRLTRRESRPSQRAGEIPPGSSGFLWSSVLACLFAGAFTGLLSKEHGFLLVSGAYVATGVVYGALCWRLAKSGWLPFPRE